MPREKTVLLPFLDVRRLLIQQPYHKTQGY